MGWIDLAQDRDRWWAVVNEVMNLSGSIQCGEFRGPVSFSGKTVLHGVSTVVSEPARGDMKLLASRSA